MAARWGVIVGVVGIAAWTPRLQAQQRPAAPAAAPSKLETIRIRPNVYVKGSDYIDASKDVTGAISIEHGAVEAHGGRVHFTDEPAMSSSQLINSHFDEIGRAHV